MDNYPLWQHVISTLKQNGDIQFGGVSIPYMIGVYHKKGIIQNLETSECLRTLLHDIIDTVQLGNEIGIFLCDSYAPYVHMIQALGNRTHQEIKVIKESYAYLSNREGKPVIYLQLDDRVGACTIETVASYLWGKYNAPIRHRTFSVVKTKSLQLDGTFNKWDKIERPW